MSINRHNSNHGFLEMQIMWMLLKGPSYGYDLMKKLSDIKGKRITQGTIYPTLKRLEKENIIEYKMDGNKKSYKLTSKGRKTSKRVCIEFTKTFSGIFKDFVCSKCKAKNNVKN